MRTRLAAVIAAAAFAACFAPAAEAHGPANPAGIDDCDWASFRNGAGNPGASRCDVVAVTNVATLQPHMLYRTRDSVTATPAVVDGMLYVGAWDGTFYAFDTREVGFGDPSFSGQPFATVEPVWEFRVTDTNGVSFGRIVSSATVADVEGTRVVVFAGGATVYVLEASTGALLASACLDPRTEAHAAAAGGARCAGSPGDQVEVESSPVLVRDPGDGHARILIGQDNHNAANVGRTGVVKLRLESGEATWSLTPEWKFDPESRVVYDGDQGPGFLTHGSGTGDGCGGVWGTPAVDVERDLVVFGTASCSSDAPDVAGEKVFAVSYSTGAEMWRFDPPRPWGTRMDDDFGASVQLFEVDEELAVGAASKDGWYYAIRASDAALIWSSQLGQPGHTTEGFAVGGVLGSPTLGTAGDKPAIFVTTAVSTPIGAPLDEGSFDSIDGTLVDDPGRMLSLHAVDASTGAVLWRSPLTRQTYGHPTYTNGLVLVTSTVGLSVEAFDAATGVPVWRSPLNGAPSSGVAVSDSGIYVGAGTRQTDLGFKIQGDDSSTPAGVQAVVGLTPAADYAGSDPQERLSGVWGFRLVG